MITLDQFKNKINFRVYAKFPGQKKFKALDLSTGLQVNNLIYATIVSIEQFDQLKKLVEMNKSICHMQIRNIKNKIVY